MLEGANAGSGAAEPGEDAAVEVIVATEPTELVALDGDPLYTPIGATGLLYFANTERTVIRNAESRRTFVLLSGRWYSTVAPDEGPWTFVPPDELPAAFAEIPKDSEMAHVLASVPGTQKAREAVLGDPGTPDRRGEPCCTPQSAIP